MKPRVDEIKSNPNLDFQPIQRVRAIGTNSIESAIYHSCQITIHESGRVVFTGSVHKMWNSINPKQIGQKIHNYNRLNAYDISLIKRHLETILCCPTSEMKLERLEFGLNVNTPFKPIEFLRALLAHHGKEFERKHDGHFAQVVHQKYRLKLYDKAYQYKINKNLLRVEIQFTKFTRWQKLKIVSFDDINQKTLENLNKELLKQFNKIEYFDSTINRNYLKGIEKYKSTHFWSETKPKNRDYHRKKLNQVISENSDNQKKILSEILKSEFVINNYSSIGLHITNRQQ